MDPIESVVDELAPREAYQALTEAPDAALIDVRTREEWAAIGMPDVSDTGKPLWPVEWVTYPTFSPNHAFMEQIEEHAGGTLPKRLFFICKVGARSMAAAQCVAAVCQSQNQAIHCTNIAEGFEGDMGAARYGGDRVGWRRCGLPWRKD